MNCVNDEESRVALVCDGTMEEIQVNLTSHSSYLGNIYKGRVVNLEPSIGAAFVDFGVGRNGFLHVSDVMPVYGQAGFKLKDLLHADNLESDGYDESGRRERRPSHNSNVLDLLRKGQEVLVQITKDGIGDKGPTLTTFVSIPGRFLVLMPAFSRRGVSRKIDDDRERRRLRRLLDQLPTPDGMGFIIRTAGAGRSRAELEGDLNYLITLWEKFAHELATGRAPKILYEESDIAIRTIRDVFTTDIVEVWVDDEAAYELIRDFMAISSPDHVNRVKHYSGPTPIFHAYGIEPQLEELFTNKIDIPGGGSIVLDQTEALVSIDVNSGKSKDEEDLEGTAFRTNMNATPEIVRQMRLRDLGGIVVIDFIDMMDGNHRRQVERLFREEFREDRARTKIGRISQFGLLEMTRQRLGPGLKNTFFSPCERCGGSGMVKTPEAQSLRVLREIQAVLGRSGYTHLEVTIPQDVERFLANSKRRVLFELEEKYGKQVSTVGDYQLSGAQVQFRFLSEDGREVQAPKRTN